MCIFGLRKREKLYVELEMQSMLDITETEVRNAHGRSYLFAPMCYANEAGCLLQ